MDADEGILAIASLDAAFYWLQLDQSEIPGVLQNRSESQVYPALIDSLLAHRLSV
jgi:hypothetical protein